MLVAIARPWHILPFRAPVLPVLGLGLSMAGVIPHVLLGGAGAVAPRRGHRPAVSRALGIALFGSRRPTDLIWALLAALGVWCVVGAGRTTIAFVVVGIAWALGAAAGWAT